MAYSPGTKLLDDAGILIGGLSDGGTENGLAVAQVATNFVFSSVNSSTAQLAAGATFNGVAETVINQQAVSLLFVADQTCTVVVRQWIALNGSAGSGLISSFSYTALAGVGLSRAFVANGNYISVHVTNNGLAATTTLNLNVAYGTLPSASGLGNNPSSINEVNGTAISADPAGAVPMSEPPTTLFYEDFGAALDTTNKWASVNSGAWTITGGNATYPVTATNTSVTTIPTFTIQASQYFIAAYNVKLEATPATGRGAFWGLGTAATTPAINSLAQEGAGFQVDTTGALQAVTYTGGVKTLIATLTRPTDNAYHRYSLIFRGALTIWTLDGIEVARATMLNIATQTVSGHMSYFSAGVTGTPQTVMAAFGIGDRSRLHTYIADPTFPWRRLAVAANGSIAVRQSASSTGTLSSVTGVAASTTLLAANANRVSALLFNDSAATLYVALAATASTTAYSFQVQGYGYWEMPVNYTGIITGIWSSATGAARITELT